MTPEQVAGLIALVDWANRLTGPGLLFLAFTLLFMGRWLPRFWHDEIVASLKAAIASRDATIVQVTRERDDALAKAWSLGAHADRAVGVAQQSLAAKE